MMWLRAQRVSTRLFANFSREVFRGLTRHVVLQHPLCRLSSTHTASGSVEQRISFWTRGRKYHKLLFVASTVAGLGVYTLYSWDVLKQRVSQEGAEVIKEGIKNEELQLTAADFSKTLLNELLQDAKLLDAVSEWLVKLLQHSDERLQERLVTLLQCPTVVGAAYAFLKQLIEQLCKDPYIQTAVAELLVAAISLPYCRDCSAEWVQALLSRDDIQNALRRVTETALLENEDVRTSASQAAMDVVARVLQDPAMIRVSQEHLATVLAEEEFQEFAGGAAWNVLKRALYPRWFPTGPLGSSAPHRGGVSEFKPAVFPSSTPQEAPSYAEHELVASTEIPPVASSLSDARVVVSSSPLATDQKNAAATFSSSQPTSADTVKAVSLEHAAHDVTPATMSQATVSSVSEQAVLSSSPVLFDTKQLYVPDLPVQ